MYKTLWRLLIVLVHLHQERENAACTNAPNTHSHIMPEHDCKLKVKHEHEHASARNSVAWEPVEARAQILGLLQSAQKSISLSTWILADNPFSREMVRIMKDRVERAGVRVTIVCFGGILPRVTGLLSRIGVQISEGPPMRLKGTRGFTVHEYVHDLVLGNHEKILVIDASVVLFSDRNLGDHYYGEHWTYTGLDVLVRGDESLAKYVDDHITSALSRNYLYVPSGLAIGAPSKKTSTTSTTSTNDRAGSGRCDCASAAAATVATTSFRVKAPNADTDHITGAYLRVLANVEAGSEVAVVNTVFLPLLCVRQALAKALREKQIQLTIVVDNVDELTKDVSVSASRDAAAGHVRYLLDAVRSVRNKRIQTLGQCSASNCCSGFSSGVSAHRTTGSDPVLPTVRLMGFNQRKRSLHSKYLLTSSTVLFGSYNMDFYSQHQEVEYVIESTDGALRDTLWAYTRNILLPDCVPVLISAPCSCVGLSAAKVTSNCSVCFWHSLSQMCPCYF